MRWMLVAGVVALTLLGCSTERGVNDAIDRSTAPLLVPTGQWRNAFDFTAPSGSTDVYQFRWNFSAGATDIVSGWQIGPTGGRGTDFVRTESDPYSEARRATLDDGCDVVDQEFGVRLCSYPSEFARGGANMYLVREVGERNLVVEYLNIDGDRNEYNPGALGVRFITADFDLVPIDGDISDYLVYIY